MRNIKNKKALIIGIAAVLILVLTVGGCGAYLSDYYKKDSQAIEAFSLDTEVKKHETTNGITVYGKNESDTGLIFYPGGKVEYTAYEPLMMSLASKGVFCVLVEMPFNLAIFDMNAADGICDSYPKIQNWYIGGHSLGGAMAAYYAEANSSELKGLILLGAYSSKDLSKTELDVLSVYGSEDGIMNREKYGKYKSNLPLGFTENIIEGGCHAFFGMYGSHSGDGTPKITAEEQIRKTSDIIIDFIAKGER